MANIKFNFILKENKNSKDINEARYFLSYQIRNMDEIKKQLSINILSLLKGNSDVIIEVKSSLLNMPINLRENCAQDFLKSVKNLGLSFRSRKVVNKNRDFFSNLLNFGMIDKELSEILVYIPDELWNNDEFIKILPKYGIRYYLLKNSGNNLNVLDDIFNGQIPDGNMLDIFGMIIYDCSSFCQMGINTNKLNYKELKDLIKSISG